MPNREGVSVSFSIILESLKFYKLKHEKTVQLWFLILYALNIVIYFLPFVDTNFDSFFYFLQGLSSGQFTADGFRQSITAGNWAYIGFSLLLNLVCAFFGLMYATLVVGERDGLKPRQALVRSLAVLPRLLLVILMLLVPTILSCYLLFIPAIVFVFMMYYLPLHLTLGKLKISEAMQLSFKDTRKQRFFIFAQVVLLSLILSIPRQLILSLVPLGVIPIAVVVTFFTVLQTFVQGKLMALLYIILVKKDQSVLPSKANS
jgi:hypothetical protein